MGYKVIGGKLVKTSTDPVRRKIFSAHEKKDQRMRTKGQYNHRCNLTSCAHPDESAKWYNRGSYAFYCESCAWLLNRVNHRDAYDLLGEGNELCVYVPTAAEAAKLHVMR